MRSNMMSEQGRARNGGVAQLGSAGGLLFLLLIAVAAGTAPAARSGDKQQVTIEGAVKEPGVYPIKGKVSLLQCIAMAGGLDHNSDLTAIVFREVEGKRAARRFDIRQIRAGNERDPPILSGNLIVATALPSDLQPWPWPSPLPWPFRPKPFLPPDVADFRGQL
jgi:hypothetical protein